MCTTSLPSNETVKQSIQRALTQNKSNFKISKTFTFEAAHHLLHHQGKCHRVHGHSYVMTIEVNSDTLHQQGSETNMVMDFDNIKKAVKPLLETLDHHDLNEVLQTDSPTAEYISMWLSFTFLTAFSPFLILRR